MREPREDLKERPENGCYIYGLFLEGARWSKEEHKLAESRAKELYTEMPVMKMIPAENRKEPESGIYVCPMYKTLTRAGGYNYCPITLNFCHQEQIVILVYL